MEDDDKIQYAIDNTEVLRPPKQSLATFGTSDINYYLVTEPVYTELMGGGDETVIREGRVTAARPKIITPSYLMNLFEGFEHGSEFAQYMIRKYGPHEPGLLYQYKNEPKKVTIVSDPLFEVVRKLNKMIDSKGDPLAAIIKGVDEVWDVSLMKFVHDITAGSLYTNVMELGGRGLLDIDGSGIPRDARDRIEELFEQIRRGEAEPFELKTELDRWGLFEEYEDRFFRLFRRW